MINKKQASYQVGRLINNNCDVVFSALALELAYFTIHDFLNSETLKLNIKDIFSGILVAYCANMAFKTFKRRKKLNLNLKEIQQDKESYPLEFSQRIIIDDLKGLDLLLSKTANEESKEWGTLLKIYDDKDNAVISTILDIASAKKMNLVEEGTRTHVCFDYGKSIEEGYNGIHHYHPNVGPKWFSGRNYALNLIDKSINLDGINLLTFNMPEGPEIIAFNRQNVYIPTNSSKKELVMATPKDIMKYLK
ncbi:MAG: hypothetical protein AB7V77_02170 [Candidatus Woesearchaeota archaeon]